MFGWLYSSNVPNCKYMVMSKLNFIFYKNFLLLELIFAKWNHKYGGRLFTRLYNAAGKYIIK